MFVFPYNYFFFRHSKRLSCLLGDFKELFRFTCTCLAIHIRIINFSMSWIHISPPYFFTSLPSLSVKLGSLSCEFCILCLSVCLSSLNFPDLTLFTVNLVLVVFVTHLTCLTTVLCYFVFSLLGILHLLMFRCTWFADTKGIKLLLTLAC